MYTHLRLHTEFSVTDGTVRIDEAVQAALQDGAQPALAITDLANLFGTVKFYKEARKNGIKPLIGAEVWVQSPQWTVKAAAHPLPPGCFCWCKTTRVICIYASCSAVPGQPTRCAASR